MLRFDAGDRVVVVQDGRDVGANAVVVGDTGTIVRRSGNAYLVDMDVKGARSSLWYLNDYHLELEDDISPISSDFLLEVLSI